MRVYWQLNHRGKIMKVKLYVQARKYTWDNEFEIVVHAFKYPPSADSTVVQLSEVEVDVPVPEINEKQLQLEEVKQLQQRITEEKNASHCRVTAIEEKIQSLLCIEAQ